MAYYEEPSKTASDAKHQITVLPLTSNTSTTLAPWYDYCGQRGTVLSVYPRPVTMKQSTQVQQHLETQYSIARALQRRACRTHLMVDLGAMLQQQSDHFNMPLPSRGRQGGTVILL